MGVPQNAEARKNAYVPPETRIRIKSIKNVTEGRLKYRLEYLRDMLPKANEWCETREEFRGRVREIVAIEDELRNRDIGFKPVTRRDWT